VIKNGGLVAYLHHPRPLQTKKVLEHRRNEMICLLFGTALADGSKKN